MMDRFDLGDEINNDIRVRPPVDMRDMFERMVTLESGERIAAGVIIDARSKELFSRHNLLDAYRNDDNATISAASCDPDSTRDYPFGRMQILSLRWEWNYHRENRIYLYEQKVKLGGTVYRHMGGDRYFKCHVSWPQLLVLDEYERRIDELDREIETERQAYLDRAKENVRKREYEEYLRLRKKFGNPDNE